MTQSRRDFSQDGSAIAAASLARPRSLFAADPGATPPLSQFGYGDVELLEGPLRQQFQTNHAFYAALDEDSLLKPYRQRAGLPAPGEDMGGWYSWENNGFAPGHSLRPIPLRSLARLRRHRRKAHAGKDSSPRA
jgi:uncharacterized protein